ncbi:MAG: hypothetical protein VBE63_30885 [Lamprobacter sp.]|uniref:hypothetical protein n=1 Tax=Lamprobacter sp. TaxID=3100796 RepID=UPI002B25AD9B|nr:hypothetical protein [Lamprobacter sp.]MEA3644296.1 hypothetical protein [Lamprobacter sp.]
MEAIRTIERVTHGELHLQVPEAFWGKEVEVIIRTTARESASLTKPHKRLRGSLNKYAHPERMAREQTAWSDTVSDAL